MIQTLHIENYRCLRDVSLELEPLTVLVGANASGKSSVLRALNAPEIEFQPWQHRADLAIRISARDTQQGQLSLSRVQGGFRDSSAFWPRCQLLQLDLARLRVPNTLEEVRLIGRDGLGLTNLFDTLARQQQDLVAKRFCELIPMFRDVAARPLTQGKHRVVFQDRWRHDVWHEPDQVSDGTMLMLAFLLLPYQSPGPDVIAIEEPERGLHPFLMGELIAALRDLAKGQLGPKPVQVVLATHSADLLEFVEPHEVRFFHRCNETGETRVQTAPTSHANWAAMLREYDNSLGDLWLSGGLGGVPGG